MRCPALALFLMLPAVAHATRPHDGTVGARGFTVSDLFLFACVAAGLWLARRALRARFRSRD